MNDAPAVTADRRASSVHVSPRTVAKNTISQIVTIGLATLMGGLATVAVARALGPDGLGVFSPAWQAAVVVGVVALLGTDQLMIRTLSRHGTKTDLEATLGLSIVLGLGFGAVVALAPWLGGVHPPLARAFAVVGGYVAISAPTWILRSGFHAKERMELETATSVAEALVAVTGVFVALQLDAGATGVIVGLGAGRFVHLVASVVVSRQVWGPIRPRFTLHRWTAALRVSIPLGVAFVFTSMLLRFDMILAGVFLPSGQAGLYSSAAIVAFTIPMAATAFNRSLYPVLSRSRGLEDPELRRLFAKTWRTLIVVGFATAVAISTLARGGLELVYGADFGTAANLLSALAWLVPIRFLNNLCAITVNATGWRRWATWATGIVVVGQLGVYVALIPIFGMWGAVAGAVGAEILLFGVLVSALRVVRPPVLGPLVQAGLVSGGVAAAALLVPGHVLVRGVVAGVVLVAGSAVLVGRQRARPSPDEAGTATTP